MEKGYVEFRVPARYVALGFLAGAILFFLLPLWNGLFHIYWPEFGWLNQLRGLAVQNFSSGTWPLWAPRMGLGGSPAQAFAQIPWDYRLLLSAWGLRTESIFAVDLLLILIASTFFVGSFFNLAWKSPARWLAGLFTFLVYYNLDFLRHFAPLLIHNQSFFVFPLLFALLYRFRQRSETKWELAGFLFFSWFLFHGLKLELWVLTLGLVLLWSMVLALVADERGNWGRARFRPVVIAVLGVVVSVVGNFWQWHWLGDLVRESGRVQASELSWGAMLADLGLSFWKAPVLQLVLLFLFLDQMYLWVAVRDLRLTEGRHREFFTLLSAALLFVGFWTFSSDFSEDLRQWKDNPLLGLGILLILIPPLLGLKVRAWEWAALVLCLSHFLLEDQKVWNWEPRWGATEFAAWSSVAQLGILVLILASLLSERKQLRQALLFFLCALYFLRAHAQVLSLGLWGVPWYIQRDSFAYDLVFVLLAGLGAEMIGAHLARVSSALAPRWRWAVGLAVAVAAVGFLQESRFLTYRRSMAVVRGAAHQDLPQTEFRKAFAEQYGDQSGNQIPTTFVDFGMGELGLFTDLRLLHWNRYDSVAPKNTASVLGASGKAETVAVATQSSGYCPKVYPWYPNNLQRLWGCTKAERLGVYETVIRSPAMTEADPMLGGVPNLWITNRREQKRPALFLGRMGPWVDVFRIPEGKLLSAVYFSKEANCENGSAPLQALTSWQTNLWEKALGRTYSFSGELDHPGCLVLPLLASKLFVAHLGATPIAIQENHGFVAVLVPAGNVDLQLTYHPGLERDLILSLGLVLLLVAAIFISRRFEFLPWPR